MGIAGDSLEFAEQIAARAQAFWGTSLAVFLGAAKAASILHGSYSLASLAVVSARGEVGSDIMIMNDKEFETAVAEFVGAFEVAFRYDWPYTKSMIGDEVPGAPFIEPGLEDEIEDWGSRGLLLERYRRLVLVVQDRGLKPSGWPHIA